MTSLDFQEPDYINTPIQLFPVFDKDGTAILPCGKKTCETVGGKTYKPVVMHCVRCGQKFRAPCLGFVYCCQECFEVTRDKEKSEARARRIKRQAKERQQRYRATAKSKFKRRLQCQRYYQRKKRGIENTDVITQRTKNVKKSPTTVSKNIAINIKPALTTTPIEAEFHAMVCRYPGCNEPLNKDNKVFFGRKRKFCCEDCRKKMDLLVRRGKRFFKKTNCPFLQKVLEYLRRVADGILE